MCLCVGVPLCGCVLVWVWPCVGGLGVSDLHSFQGLSYLEDIAAMHRDRLAAELKGAELKAAELKDAELKDAELKDAELKDAELKDAELKDAELKDAELKDAELKDAELKDAKLMDAEFKAWLLLLVQLVDASDEVEDLKALLARKHSLSERFYDCIEEQVHLLLVQCSVWFSCCYGNSWTCR